MLSRRNPLPIWLCTVLLSLKHRPVSHWNWLDRQITTSLIVLSTCIPQFHFGSILTVSILVLFHPTSRHWDIDSVTDSPRSRQSEGIQGPTEPWYVTRLLETDPRRHWQNGPPKESKYRINPFISVNVNTPSCPGETITGKYPLIS